MNTLSQYVLLIILLFSGGTVLAQAPVANFTAKYVSGCAPLCDSFYSTSTGNPTSFLWNFGNGVTSTLPNPSVCFSNPGTYTVSLTVSNASGSSTKTMNITVFAGPNVNFTASPMAGCPPINVNFTNSTTSSVPGPITYTWQYGDGSPLGTGTNSSHLYTTPGGKAVILTATDAQGCVSSLSKIITVHAPPIFNFTAPVAPCDTPALVTFSPTVTGTPPYMYQWSFGDGGTANAVSPSHTYHNPGPYTVRLIVTDGNGCKDTLEKQNYINVGTLLPDFSASTPCQGTPVQFTNLSNLMDSVRWKFGDGGTDTARNPAHIYASSGTFNVKLYVYYKGCLDSIVKPVVVHPKPDAQYTFSPPHPCPPPSTVTFINQSTGAVHYIWDFGDGNISNLPNPVHTYTYDTAFFPKLIAISNQGCPDTSYMEDTVINYIAVFSVQSPDLFRCLGDTVRFGHSLRTIDYFNIQQPFMPYPFPVVNFYWDFGDGTTSTDPFPWHIYPTRGVFRASLTATTSNGCTFTDTIAVLVGQKPDASFTFSPDTVCNHGTITINNTTTGATYYMWDMGNHNSWGDTVHGSFTFTYDESGIDTIILYAYDYGCGDTFYATKPIVVHPPTSFWTAVVQCDSVWKVQFYDTLSHEPTSHWWSFGDGDTTSATNPLHIYPALGSYVVSLYTHNSIYGCYDTLTQQINLIDPILTFSTPDTAICEGDSIVFTPHYPLIPRWDFNWYFGPGPYYGYPLPATSSFRTKGVWGYRFTQRGVYVLTLLAEDEIGCVDTFRKTILVGMPDAGFYASTELACAPATITFTDTTIDIPPAFQTTREWDFGNGNVVTTNTGTVSNQYTAAGLYTVSLIVTDNIGCVDTLVKTQYIDIRDPVPGFYASDSNACMKQLLAFTNTTTGSGNNYTSFWDFGDGTTDTARNPVHAYHQTGSFTVKLVVTDTVGCKDSITKVAYINVNHPDAQFTASDTLSICPPMNVIFINTSSGALTYAWDLGNGTNTTLQNPTGSYVTPGIYNVRLIVANAQNCKDTAYGRITVLGYAGMLDYTPLKGCAPLQVSFKSQLLNVPNTIWDFGDGIIKPTNGSDTTTHIYAAPGAYLPKLVLSDNTGCQNSSPGLDTIRVDDVIAGFITSPACVNTPVTFMDTSFSYFSQVTGWRWTFNNGIYTAPSPTLSFSSAGSFPVKLAVTNATGCQDSISTTFTIYGLPHIKAVSDTSICSGDAAQLSASGGILYTWSPAATLSCDTCQNPTARPAGTMNYVVKGIDGNGCASKDTVKVSIQYVTTSVAGPGGEICEDSTFQLYASGAHRYEWMPASLLDNPLLANPLASPKTTTTFTVIAWEGSCPPDTNTVRVVVYPKPTVDAGSDETIVAGSTVMLNAKGSNIQTYLWSPAQTLSCETCSNPSASPMTSTLYKVIVTSQHGCKSYDTVRVRVLCDQSQVFIPNSFTPNGDGENDVFYPRGVGLQQVTSFRVYNRWGEVVFERRNIQLNDRMNGWDGTYKGNVQNPDVFVYIVEGLCESGEPIMWKGDVSLLR